MKVKVYAKLNLTLDVFAKQGEFHPIDSVVTSVDVYDTVEVVKRNDMQVNVRGVDEVEQERNTAYKAAVAFKQAFAKHASQKITGVDIDIHKGIPFGAGMGGSSADAAAVVYCMCKLFGVDIYSHEIHELCSYLGSDVNFMLFGGLARLQGKGDDVTFSSLTKPLYFALTTFDTSMNSGEVYSAYDKSAVEKHDFSSPYIDYITFNNSTCWHYLRYGNNRQAIQTFSNSLQQATASINNYADEYINFVKIYPLRFNMTGSGSAYYVACVTKEEAERVAELLTANGFTTTVCKSVPNGIVEI